MMSPILSPLGSSYSLRAARWLVSSIYYELTDEVIGAYWEDFADHKTDFMPAFLANDIIRLWRTLCVNYEARTEREPEEKKAERRLKNYKLKHSRLLTCYSALLYLLAVYETSKVVTPEDAKSMMKLTPTQRLEWLRDHARMQEARPSIEKLLDQYEKFLVATNASEAELISRFLDKERRREYAQSESDFGDSMFGALNKIGQGGRFHRLLVRVSSAVDSPATSVADPPRNFGCSK